MGKQNILMVWLISLLALSSPTSIAMEVTKFTSDEAAFVRLGQTRVQVMLFKVYDATLETDTGRYPGYNRLRLSLRYLRSISSESLVEATAKEWRRLGFPTTQVSLAWLQQLASIWPHVTAGDMIIAEHVKGEGIVFTDSQKVLGVIESEQFAQQFLAIWLSDKSRFRSNRNELLGLNERGRK